MNCCTLEGTNKFFNTQARRSEKYFKKKGLRKEQQYLAEGIRQKGLREAEILEIGCGVGGLHLSLLKDGAAKATGFDISEKMIATARRLSAEMQLQDRTQYRHGDFVAMHENAPVADVTILDKVICCYENAPELIAHSTAKTRRIYAVSYPRRHVLVKLMFRSAKFFLKLFRQAFHPYYHEPAQIQNWIGASGFEKVYERETCIWLIQIFERKMNGRTHLATHF
ncbi:MAG: methyltransferase domain-containing protein [candidate division KSB1 bacterium]|nr:methyltransferase domain-containing protein [candidate division KSB1 bacterium]MDZ7369166.1 methyltransferase domain-containing protein [candidate division KSB1 bacterium]MDZ7407140.1 methyltransferase domain-containing protein [candidate division KSB1 bacterium]